MAFGLWVVIYSISIFAAFSETERQAEKFVGREFAPIATICVIGLASLLTLFLTSLHPLLGRITNALYWCIVIWFLYKRTRTLSFDNISDAALVWTVATAFVLLFALAPLGSENPIELARSVWSHELPVDNELPFMFASYLYAGEVPSPMLEDWLGSDRPPLQSGYFLLTKPWLVSNEVAYQMAGTSAQMLILPAAWSLAKQFNLKRTEQYCISAILLSTPLVLINGIYVWPKLLAAAFLVCAAAIHFTPLYKTHHKSIFPGAFVGCLSACAVLSHGAAAFTIVGFGFVALVSGRIGSLKYTSAAIIAAVVLYSPWIAYQKFIDPPGDRLMKWHLAGVIDANDERSAIEAITDEYSQFTLTELGSRQLTKMRFSLEKSFELYSPSTKPEETRKAMFFHMVPAMGYLGILALVAAIIGLWTPTTRLFTGSVVASYASWILFSFKTGVVVHESSYFTYIGALLILCLVLNRWPKALYIAALAQLICALVFFT